MPAHYTSEDLACALGLEGFANDSEIAHAEASIRLLLQPSDGVELCLTLVKREGRCTLTVIRAREQIRMWDQIGGIPKPVATICAEAAIVEEVFERLAAALCRAAEEEPTGVVILDGTLSHAVLRRDSQCHVNIHEHLGCRPMYEAFVAAVLDEAWNVAPGTLVRNALFLSPARDKQIVQTVVLGPADVSADILEGLKRHHQD